MAFGYEKPHGKNLLKPALGLAKKGITNLYFKVLFFNIKRGFIIFKKKQRQRKMRYNDSLTELTLATNFKLNSVK